MRRLFVQWLRALSIAATTFVAGSAFAGFSTVGKTPDFEVSHQQILQHHYGGAWHKVGDDFYSGSISAKRMDDFLSSPGVLDMAIGECGYSTDQLWRGDRFTATAVAKWSGNSQNLNLIDSLGNVEKLFSVKGYGFDIEPASVTVDMKGDTFKWQRRGDSGVQTSLDLDNADLRDHLITYVIENLPGATGPVWMLFFEDMNRFADTPLKKTWADYNDLVVEIRAIPHAVPLPPAGWAGLATLSGIVLVRGRKHFLRVLSA